MPSFVTRPPIRRRGQNWFPLSRSSTRGDKTGSGGAVLGGAAMVDLSVPSVDSEVSFLWDYDNDGDFDEVIEDTTAYVMAMETFGGRDFPSQINGEASVGRLRVTLNNEDDRFSYFNADSDLNTDPYTLKLGRKVRVIANGTAHPDPTLLAKDLFNRATFSSGLDTGQSWTQPLSNFGTQATITPQEGGAEATMEGQTHVAVVDVGETDYYAQVRVIEVGDLTTGRDSNTSSLVYRWQDTNNYSLLRINPDDDAIELLDVVAGVISIEDSVTIGSSGRLLRDKITLGVHVVDDEVTGYIDGVARLSATAIQTDETEVGIRCVWATGQPAPVFDDFYVWDGLPVELEGVLWTGKITNLDVNVTPGPMKVATLEAEGAFADAANQDVIPAPSPASKLTGQQIGNILCNAQLMNPPGPHGSIMEGDVSSSPLAYDDFGKAFDLIRVLEDLEVGYLSETNEGYYKYISRSARDSMTSQVLFSDAPGAQFAYSKIQPLDSRKDIINRVTAGLGQKGTGVVSGSGTSDVTASGTANPISLFLMDGAEEHDLRLIVIASGIRSDNEQWLVPIYWVPLLNRGDDLGLRIYARITNGDDDSDLVTFYNDEAGVGGAWVANQYLIKDWYGVHEGLEVAEPAKGNTPPAILPSWGSAPSVYIALRFGAGPSGNVSASPSYPLGYVLGNTNDEDGAGALLNVALQAGVRRDNVAVTDPGDFTGFSGMSSIDESTVIAIRGYNNSQPPPRQGLNYFTKDDTASQLDHGAVRVNRTIPELFNSEEDAEEYTDFVLARHSEDHLLLSMTFYPVIGQHYRQQAIKRRVNDKITVRAENNAGLGIDGDYFIESISHRWSNGIKLWETTWELSPA